MAHTREESSEESSDRTSSDNFSIYTETSSSEQDLQNLVRTSQNVKQRELNRNHLRNSRL